jgi:hypothetical protein
MRKLILLIFGVMLSSVPLVAQDNAGQRQLVLLLASGEQIAYLTSEQPSFQLIDDKLVLTSMRVQVEYEAKDITKFSLEKAADTGIEQMEQTGKAIPSYSDGFLSISNAQPHTPVGITDLRGVVVRRLTVGDDGQLVVNLNMLPAGVYIINIGRNIVKITKK